MDVLRDYSEEFAEVFRTSFNFLFVVNVRIWFRGEGFVTRYWRFLLVGPVTALCALAGALDAALLLHERRAAELAIRMPSLLVMLQGVLKGVLLVPKTDDIGFLIRELGTLWRRDGDGDGDRRALRTKLLRQINFCNRGLFWYASAGVGLYLTTPLAQTLAQTPAALAAGRLQPIAGRYPFALAASWPRYLAVYAFQSCGMFASAMAYNGAEVLMMTLSALLSAEFSLLSADLRRRRRRPRSSLCDVVRRHQALVRLSALLDNIFNKMVFVDLLFVGGTTCFFRFAAQFSRGPTDMVVNYAAGMGTLFYVFYVCYFGEQLSAASLSIADAAYESLWYEADKQDQKIIYMIMKRAQTPCCLTSIKYAPVTLHMFTKVMSTTYSYLSLMNRMYEEEA